MHNFKRVCALILTVIMLISLCACGSSQKEVVLDVFAPNQSLGIVSTLVASYHKVQPNVTMRITYDSGAMLAAKIEAGYNCDIFIADDTYFLDWLDKAADTSINVNGNDRIYSDSRRNEVLVGPADEEYATEEGMLALYSIAVVKPSTNRAVSEAFINYFLGESADEVYEEWGFARYTE